MDARIERIRRAYDLTVEQYRQGIDPLKNLPEEIRRAALMSSWVGESEWLGSGSPDIREFLNPQKGMRFLDAGCSANLVNYRLDRWPSTYYGVDISPRLIEAMQAFAVSHRIEAGGLYVSEITALPFQNEYFDISALIGVLEYHPLDYIRESLEEVHRVCRLEARLVIDIPNPEHPQVAGMAVLENYLERPIFLHSRADFEKLLSPWFSIQKCDDARIMLKYFLRRI